MFYIYILHSKSTDKYYVGHTDNFDKRLEQHNHKEDFNTFTSKYRPWAPAALFECGDNRGLAMEIESFIKKQKSRNLIEKLIDPNFSPKGKLAMLVRIPYEYN